MQSLQQAVAGNKVKVGSAGKLRMNDLAPAPSTVTSTTEDPTKRIADIAMKLDGKVADPAGTAAKVAAATTEDEAKAVLMEDGVDEGSWADLLPYILGGAAIAGGGLALKAALAKRKKGKPSTTIGGVKNEKPHGPGSNGASTVDGGELKAARTSQARKAAPLALPAPQKQIGTDIMPDDKAMSELQRVLMNIGSIGKRKGKIK